jgi:hypothetical protein
MPYYDNPGMLRLHLDTWAHYPKDLRDRFRFVIVDDASPNGPAEPVLREHPLDLDVHLFRIEKDIPWGWPAAKNIAMHEIPDGPALVTDIDHVLEADDAARLVAMNVRPDTHYVPARRKVDRSPYKRHPSTYILQRSLYWHVGGYEENWLGLYGSDFMMRNRIQRMSRRREIDDVTLTLWGRSDLPDASTTTLPRKEGPYYSGNMPEVRAAMHKAVAGPVLKTMTQDYRRIL